MTDKQFNTTMETIVVALKERGCDPYAQLLGYITTNETTYITKNKSARALIQSMDFDRVKHYVKNMSA